MKKFLLLFLIIGGIQSGVKACDPANLFNLKNHDHKDTVHLSQKWKGSITGNMEAEIILYLDHEGNTVSKKSGFTIR